MIVPCTILPSPLYCDCWLCTIISRHFLLVQPEAEFLYVIGTKVLRVFLLDSIQTDFTTPPPPHNQQKWFETRCKRCIWKPQVWELSRLCPETSTKAYVLEFGSARSFPLYCSFIVLSPHYCISITYDQLFPLKRLNYCTCIPAILVLLKNIISVLLPCTVSLLQLFRRQLWPQ